MNNSIGSLAALAAAAAFAAPALSEAAPQTSSVDQLITYENISSVDLDFDLDGNGSTDFSLYSNGLTLRLDFVSGTRYTFDPVGAGSLLSLDDNNNLDIFTPSESYAGFYSTDQVPNLNQSDYYGISFERGGSTHLGWLLLAFDSEAGLRITGGWESAAGAVILVGDPSPVPEPSSAAALAGAAALTGVVALRRRRPATTA